MDDFFDRRTTVAIILLAMFANVVLFALTDAGRTGTAPSGRVVATLFGILVGSILVVSLLKLAYRRFGSNAGESSPDG